jgi:gamma-glutamylcyclotransferase
MASTHSTQWYFAYGSNMWKQQMLKRTGSIPEGRRARLDGYRLAFRKYHHTDEVYADVLPDASQCVLGVAYQCSAYALERLDIFEGVADGCYRRDLVHVQSEETGETLQAIVYRGCKSFSEIESQPSQEYLDRILAGLRDHQFATAYIQAVRDMATQQRNHSK